MSTSGGGTVNALLYLVMLACSVRAARVLLDQDLGQSLRRSLPMAAAGWLIVAIPSLLQNVIPGLLHRLRREPHLIRHDGQWWRLVTSGVVQDGGLAGTVFNLAILAVIAAIAVRIWGARRAASIFLGALVAFNLAATFVFPATGAGNSAATFGLATSITGLALASRATPILMLLAGITAVDGVWLLTLSDAHGEIVLAGLLTGLGLGLAWAPNRHRHQPD
jgi:membrane associated rhomboid family serine protease